MLTAGSSQQSAQRGQPNLERQYTETVRPFTVKYCVSCHGEKGIAAQFDLRPYTTLASVVKDHEHWALVLSKLQAGEMPPAVSAAQPAPAERQAVIAWVDAMRKAEARRNAGDPGLVLARRLSTRSQTRFAISRSDSTRPRASFTSNRDQAGFDNSGESLAMSHSWTNTCSGARSGNHMCSSRRGLPLPRTLCSSRQIAIAGGDQYRFLQAAEHGLQQ